MNLKKIAVPAAIVIVPSVAWAALCAVARIDPAIAFLGGYVVGTGAMLSAIYWNTRSNTN